MGDPAAVEDADADVDDAVEELDDLGVAELEVELVVVVAVLRLFVDGGCTPPVYEKVLMLLAY